MSADAVRFTVPGLAPASWSGNSRVHWRKRHADGDEYAERVWTAGYAAPLWPKAVRHLRMSLRRRLEQAPLLPWPKAHLTLTQRAVRPRDHDNFLASFKPGLDTLTTKGKRPLGIIVDDTSACLSIEVRTERVKHRKDEGVLVELVRQ